MVCERSDAFASACALARAFPLFTHRSGAARRTEKKTVTVEFFLVGQDNGPVEVSTLQVGVQMFAPCPRPTCAGATGEGGGERSLGLPGRTVAAGPVATSEEAFLDQVAGRLPRGGTLVRIQVVFTEHLPSAGPSRLILRILSVRMSVPLCVLFYVWFHWIFRIILLRPARLGGTPG